jgi:hypothetical protein
VIRDWRFVIRATGMLDSCLEHSLEMICVRGRREFQLSISRAQELCVVAKSIEKLEIRMGRCCLFSVICAGF